jgi:Cellulase (glycosyl hydrolase family 5)
MRWKTLVATALAAACLIGPTTSAHAARGMEVALQDDSVFLNNSWYGRDLAFQRAHELGVTRLRVNFLWARSIRNAGGRSTPADPGYNWGNFDSLVNQAAAQGIKVQLTLTGPAPAWATGNHRIGVVNPNAAKFARFAADVAAHFKGRVDRYGIWNEPNWKSWLEPHNKSPRIYRNLYKGAYAAIKRADPSAKVLIGETSPQARGRAGTAPLTWLRAMVGNSHLKADGYAHHPYDYRNSPHRVSGTRNDVTIASLGRLTHELSALARKHRLSTPRGGALPVYLTEYGYLVHGRFALNEKKAAKYLAQAFSIALHNPHVKSMLQYGLVSPPLSVNWDSSLIAANGHARRLYYSLQSWVKHARGALAK